MKKIEPVNIIETQKLRAEIITYMLENNILVDENTISLTRRPEIVKYLSEDLTIKFIYNKDIRAKHILKATIFKHIINFSLSKKVDKYNIKTTKSSITYSTKKYHFINFFSKFDNTKHFERAIRESIYDYHSKLLYNDLLNQKFCYKVDQLKNFCKIFISFGTFMENRK